MEWAEIIDRFASALFPQRCLFCDDVVAYDDFWCGKCKEDGNPLYTKLGRLDCDIPHGFTDVIAAVDYIGAMRKLVWRLKDKGDRRILQFFAGEMHGMISQYWDGIPFDLIVPVPSTASRLKERGFNQAEKLARYVSQLAGLPMCGDALIRCEATQVQRDLTAAERRINAAMSYGPGNVEIAAGKTVLLVDDVFTTGSTASACSDQLLEAGAERVYVITAAASDHPGIGDGLQNH